MHEIIENPHLAKQFIQQVGDVDALITATKKCLEVFPPGKIRIRLFENDAQVQWKYKSLYGKDCKYRAFSSIKIGTIYLSIQKKWFQSNLQEVLVHEIAHVELNKHFGPGVMPDWQHELLAQYATANYRRYM